MKNRIAPVMSWILVAWICNVFLSSLFYKFTGQPDTVHIFTTISGLMTSTVMAGAVFFHLASPLGVEVLHEDKRDRTHSSMLPFPSSCLVSFCSFSTTNIAQNPINS